ncbi:MAG TPA: YraN family protein [Candidatus Saccharimonadales bacterium]|nr:YraN family protein [Candidatus Saccharimonadales bacterium]
MTTVDTGRKAEQVVADFLVRKGCVIMDRNWRTRWCEIDVVARRDGIVYFCEVKYRLRAAQGGGLDYITPKKVEQMWFAAELWVQSHNWQGEYELCAIEVFGPEFTITGVVKDLG